MLLIAVVLVVLNTYPVIVSRDLVFASKKVTLQGQSSLIGTSVEALDVLTRDSVSQVMTMLNITGMDDVLIVGSDNEILYIWSSGEGGEDTNAIPMIDAAMKVKDVFRSRFEDGVFYSSSAVPIMIKGAPAGAVYIREYDEEQGGIITGLQRDLGNISLFLAFFSVVLSIIFSKTFSSRVFSLLKAIDIVREGEYSYRIPVKGSDELSRLGEELNSLTDRLQRTEEIRRVFVADASHELRTPLASIRLLSDSIAQSPEMDQETIREFASDIGNEAERLARTTEQLLDLTKLDNDTPILRVYVDLKDVIEKALRVLRPLADNRNIEIRLSFDEGCTVFATFDDIYHIVINLVENAVKYNVDGGTVDLSLKKGGGRVEFTVEDTGIGIPPQDMDRIFDRFYRVDKARAREAGGSGLGLSIVSATVARHGGTVHAVNRSDTRGMRFSVEFPYYSDAEKGRDN